MNALLNLLFKIKYPQERSRLGKPTSGFTMIELLVGTVIAVLLTVPMLTFVVDILNRDVREQAKTNTEQDVQAAMDYIAQDMNQAVYIYDSAGVTAIENDLPPFTDTSRKPVLAFWKRQVVEDALLLSGDVCDSETSNCDDTFVYSLVVYYLIEDDSDTWCDPDGTCKRIARYQIQDGVKSGSGYVCGTNGRDTSICNTAYKQKFMRDKGYRFYINDDSTTDLPQDWTPETDNGEILPNSLTVLVSYIENFELDGVDNNKLATVTLEGNALRRIQTNAECTNSPSFCPKVNAQVGGRSGFGES